MRMAFRQILAGKAAGPLEPETTGPLLDGLRKASASSATLPSSTFSVPFAP